MKKIIILLLTIFFTSSVYAHSTKGHTPNLDYKVQCTKKKSVLNFISKHRLFKGKGEKCIEKGVTIGRKNMDQYMPQFINFFKENLL